MRPGAFHAALFALILGAAVLRTIHPASDPPPGFVPGGLAEYTDEGFKTYHARSRVLFGSWLPHPADRYTYWLRHSPLAVGLQAAWFALRGRVDVTTAREPYVIAGLLALVFWALAVRRAVGERVALGTTAFLAASQVGTVYGRMAFLENLLLLAAAVVAWLLCRPRSPGVRLAAAAIVASAFLVKPTAVPLAVAAGAGGLLLAAQRGLARRIPDEGRRARVTAFAFAVVVFAGLVGYAVLWRTPALVQSLMPLPRTEGLAAPGELMRNLFLLELAAKEPFLFALGLAGAALALRPVLAGRAPAAGLAVVAATWLLLGLGGLALLDGSADRVRYDVVLLPPLALLAAFAVRDSGGPAAPRGAPAEPREGGTASRVLTGFLALMILVNGFFAVASPWRDSLRAAWRARGLAAAAGARAGRAGRGGTRSRDRAESCLAAFRGASPRGRVGRRGPRLARPLAGPAHVPDGGGPPRHRAASSRRRAPRRRVGPDARPRHSAALPAPAPGRERAGGLALQDPAQPPRPERRPAGGSGGLRARVSRPRPPEGPGRGLPRPPFRSPALPTRVASSLSDPTQVVTILADGARPDVLERLHLAGRIPALSRLLIEPAGGRVRVATSVLPSTTGPAHLPFLTGRFPGPSNVPGIRWLDPHVYAAHRFNAGRFRSYMGLGSLRYDRDLAPGVRTVFELVPDHATAGSTIRRGVRRGRDLTRWAKPLGSLASFVAEDWSRLDRLVSERTIRAVARGTRFVFAALYAVDALGHKYGPEDERTLAAYGLVDDLVGGLAQAARGATTEPLVLVVSDHGQSETHGHLDLAGRVEREIGLCFAHPRVWRGRFHAQAAVMVSGNAMAHVYRLGGEPPGTVRLDALPVALAHLVEALLQEEAVDQVIGRRGDGVVILSRRGRADVRRLPDGLAYDVVQGEDPFGYPEPVAGRHHERELLALTWASEYPDAPLQALQIFDSPRCGDLVVTARPGFDLRARFERPPHRGSHGSLHRLHVRTPLLANRILQPGPARTVDVLPTVLDALGVRVPEGLDGRSLWPPVRETRP